MCDVLWVSYSEGNLIQMKSFCKLEEAIEFIEKHPGSNLFYRGRELVLTKETANK